MTSSPIKKPCIAALSVLLLLAAGCGDDGAAPAATTGTTGLPGAITPTSDTVSRPGSPTTVQQGGDLAPGQSVPEGDRPEGPGSGPDTTMSQQAGVPGSTTTAVRG